MRHVRFGHLPVFASCSKNMNCYFDELCVGTLINGHSIAEVLLQISRLVLALTLCIVGYSRGVNSVVVIAPFLMAVTNIDVTFELHVLENRYVLNDGCG